MVTRPLGYEEYDIDEFLAIPRETIEGIHRYVEHGIQPGDFLKAVIRNDLKEAVGRADHNNLRVLKLICQLIHNYAPSDCHGSREKLIAWMRVGGTEGLRMQEEDQ